MSSVTVHDRSPKRTTDPPLSGLRATRTLSRGSSCRTESDISSFGAEDRGGITFRQAKNTALALESNRRAFDYDRSFAKVLSWRERNESGGVGRTGERGAQGCGGAAGVGRE